MKRALFCTACGRQLSRAATIVSSKTPGVMSPTLADKEPPMPDGDAFESHKPWIVSGGMKGDHLVAAPQIWINLGDLTGEPRYTPHIKRLSGCCGLAGSLGPNRVCECGAHIGTELSDCWTPAMFVPDPSFTRWEDTEGEP
jgi:hypothetical protein